MILGTNTDIKINLFLDGNKIEKSQEVFLLGITIDDKLSFKRHVENISKIQITRVARHKEVFK